MGKMVGLMKMSLRSLLKMFINRRYLQLLMKAIPVMKNKRRYYHNQLNSTRKNLTSLIT